MSFVIRSCPLLVEMKSLNKPYHVKKNVQFWIHLRIFTLSAFAKVAKGRGACIDVLQIQARIIALWPAYSVTQREWEVSVETRGDTQSWAGPRRWIATGRHCSEHCVESPCLCMRAWGVMRYQFRGISVGRSEDIHECVNREKRERVGTGGPLLTNDCQACPWTSLALPFPGSEQGLRCGEPSCVGTQLWLESDSLTGPAFSQHSTGPGILLLATAQCSVSEPGPVWATERLGQRV